MDRYYKILGVDELTSKPLLRIAYVSALNYVKQQQIEDAEVIDIHLAYQLLRKYRFRFRKWKKKGINTEQDQALQQIITDTRQKIENGRIDTSMNTSKIGLEIKYGIRTMFLGVFALLLSIISDVLLDFLMLTMDVRGFLASLIFFFLVLNIFGNWIESYYSVLLILVAIGLFYWHLKSFERDVIKAVKSYLHNTQKLGGLKS